MLASHLILLSMGCACSSGTTSSRRHRRTINPASSSPSETDIGRSRPSTIRPISKAGWFGRNGTVVTLNDEVIEIVQDNNFEVHKVHEVRSTVGSGGINTGSLQTDRAVEPDDDEVEGCRTKLDSPPLRMTVATQSSGIRRQDVAVNTSPSASSFSSSSSSSSSSPSSCISMENNHISMACNEYIKKLETILPGYASSSINVVLNNNHPETNNGDEENSPAEHLSPTTNGNVALQPAKVNPYELVAQVNLTNALDREHEIFPSDLAAPLNGNHHDNEPGLMSLSEGRKSYDIATQTDRSLSVDGDEDAPEFAATPPKIRKSQLIEHCKWHDIDQHARRVPEVGFRTAWSLVKYLKAPAKSDLDIVRVFYVWITNNLRYDLNFADIRQTAGDILEGTKSGVAIDFCNLFSEMCRIGEIRVKQIRGFAKGYEYKPGHKFRPNQDGTHVWNVVFLRGAWRFVDCTYGAGFLNTVGTFQRRFKDHYFLTDPDSFIWTHFPYSEVDDNYSRWQLLEVPVSLDEFNSTHRVTPHFFEYRMKIRKPSSTCPVVFSHTTEISLSAPEVMQYKYKLFSVDGVESGEFNQYVFCQLRDVDRLLGSFQVTPPLDGGYILKIYAHPEHSLRADTMLDCVVVFVLDCVKTWKNVPRYPKNDYPWGTTRYFYDYQLRMVNLSNPIVVVVSGRKTIILEKTQDMIFSQQLYNVSGDEVTDKGILASEGSEDGIDEGIVKFVVRPPGISIYKLAIFASPRTKKHRDGSCRLQLVATFAIDCKQSQASSNDLREQIFTKSKNSRKTSSQQRTPS